jgi:hypothetical protein
MFTAKLVPLGGAFEKEFGKCNGYGSKSLQELLGSDAESMAGGERDIPLCKPSAGAPPCHLLDFSEVTTARQFHSKMEILFNQWLKKHCNDEWAVHFRALLVRMRHSLFCDDGSQSDHPGYIISTMSPPTTQKPQPMPYKPTGPMPTPYKPTNPPVKPTNNPYVYPGPGNSET